MKVTYDDHMGDDLKVVNMARVSFGKRSEWEWVSNTGGHTVYPKDYSTEELVKFADKSLSKADQSLIAFLARGCTSGEWVAKLVLASSSSDDYFYGYSGEAEEQFNALRKMPSHWTPFGHCQITLHMKVPIFEARQIHKHQVGFVVNEVSRRYVSDEPEFYVPEVWRKAADNVKQGSSDEEVSMLCLDDDGSQARGLPMLADRGGKVGSSVRKANFALSELYQEMLDSGVAPEQARLVLPQSMYTEFYITGSLKGWTDMYNQRSDPHAQKEVQMVAEQIKEIIEPLYPISWKELTK